MTTMTVDLDDLRRRMCTGKIPYGAVTARDVAQVMRRNHPRQQFGAYRCIFCHRWHVGHAPCMAAVEEIAAAIRQMAADR